MKVSITKEFSDYDLLCIAESSDGKRKATEEEVKNFMHSCVEATLQDKSYDYEKEFGE